MNNHLVIPDVQADQHSKVSHLKAAGNLIVEHQPEVITCIGDFWDMPSLSSYDKGKKGFEARRYKHDIEAGLESMECLLGPMKAYNAKRRKNSKKQYKPKMIYVYGNHEERINRALNSELTQLEGMIGFQDFRLKENGWIEVPFLKYYHQDGIIYTHYVANDMSGTPKATAKASIEKTMYSVTQGHKQILDIHTRPVADGRILWSIIAGAFYKHEEGYKGPQGNIHWRGLIYKTGVQNGEFSPTFMDIERLEGEYL